VDGVTNLITPTAAGNARAAYSQSSGPTLELKPTSASGEPHLTDKRLGSTSTSRAPVLHTKSVCLFMSILHTIYHLDSKGF
jgi:hypothetical protein